MAGMTIGVCTTIVNVKGPLLAASFRSAFALTLATMAKRKRRKTSGPPQALTREQYLRQGGSRSRNWKHRASRGARFRTGGD